jgi:hypothetical protein
MTLPLVRGDDPPSATERVAKLRLELRSQSLAELDAQGIIRWEQQKHVVGEGPNFDRKFAAVVDDE